MGEIVGIGPCYSCRQVFMFVPEKVPCIMVDPATGIPPDVDPDTGKRLPDGTDVSGLTSERLASLDRRPLCKSCVAIVNDARKAHGEPPVEVAAGTYLEMGLNTPRE